MIHRILSYAACAAVVVLPLSTVIAPDVVPSGAALAGTIATSVLRFLLNLTQDDPADASMPEVPFIDGLRAFIANTAGVLAFFAFVLVLPYETALTLIIYSMVSLMGLAAVFSVFRTVMPEGNPLSPEETA